MSARFNWPGKATASKPFERHHRFQFLFWGGMLIYAVLLLSVVCAGLYYAPSAVLWLKAFLEVNGVKFPK